MAKVKKEYASKHQSMSALHAVMGEAHERIRIARKVQDMTAEVFFFDEHLEDSMQGFIADMLDNAQELLHQYLVDDDAVLYGGAKQYHKAK